MAARAILAFGACVLLLTGCGTTPRPAERAAPQPETYVVKPNDTLSSIASRHGLDYREVARWNRIGADFKITVGQRLWLGPPADAAPAAGTATVPRQKSLPGSTAVPPLLPANPEAQSAQAVPSPVLTALQWAWPTLHAANPQRVPGGGILITGQIGQDIRAASAGKVVYNGNGIRGYGNLIIIRHGERALTAYAHNRDTQVHEGDEVLLGQVIAHMGEGAPGKPVLYFEIRLDGKPVDPVAVLTSTESQ